jgi:hypothetical protein
VDSRREIPVGKKIFTEVERKFSSTLIFWMAEGYFVGQEKLKKQGFVM